MPKNERQNETKVNPATTTGDSLRTTIPKFIVDQFNIKPGTILVWKIKDETHIMVEVKRDGAKRRE